LKNPYWDRVKDSVKPSEFPWEVGVQQVGRFKFDWQEGDPPILDRTPFVKMYSWTITDPRSIEFVRTVAYHGIVDPMAGTGYWAYVLGQVDVDVVCYDEALPEENHYHKGAEPWVDIEQLDAALAVVKHPDRALLLAWPPYSEDVGVRAINAYKGDRIVYIGEGHGGCTGSDAMHQILDEEWRQLAEHTPVQWWGLHDRITVYERRSRVELENVLTWDRDGDALRTRAKRIAGVPGLDAPARNLVSKLQRSE